MGEKEERDRRKERNKKGDEESQGEKEERMRKKRIFNDKESNFSAMKKF